MISLEGLTLLTGRHRRGARHPADLRPPHSRRPDSQSLPRGARPRGSITRRTPPSGSFTPSDRYEAASRRARDAPFPASQVGRDRPEALRRHSLRDRRRRRRRALAPGRGRLPAHLDGRQGGRLGGDAAAGESGRDQRAFLQRASPARAMAEGGGGRHLGPCPASLACAPPTSKRAPSACARPSTSGSGTPPAAASSMSSTRRTAPTPAATIPAFGPISCWPSRWRTRSSIVPAGRPC